jgi:hypothetical protein
VLWHAFLFLGLRFSPLSSFCLVASTAFYCKNFSRFIVQTTGMFVVNTRPDVRVRIICIPSRVKKIKDSYKKEQWRPRSKKKKRGKHLSPRRKHLTLQFVVDRVTRSIYDQ